MLLMVKLPVYVPPAGVAVFNGILKVELQTGLKVGKVILGAAFTTILNVTVLVQPVITA